MFIRKSFRPTKGKEKGSRVQKGFYFDPASPDLPLAMEKCLEALERHLKEPGLFRLSGSSSQLAELRGKLNNPQGLSSLDVSAYDPHVISGCLKGYLRELAEPVCTFELYDCWLSAVLPFREARVTCVRKLLTFLPIGHTVLLQRICCLLRKVASFADENKMNATNLAIVFAPTFFRRQGETMEEMVSDQETVLELVKHLINDYEYIFEDKPIPPEPVAAESSEDSSSSTSLSSSSSSTASSSSSSAAAASASSGQATNASSPGSLSSSPSATGSQQNSGRETKVGIALWDCEALSGAELSFKALDLILIEEVETENTLFWFGSLLAQPASRGFFQHSYVQLLDPNLRVAQALTTHTFSQPELLSCTQGELFVLEPTCAHADWFEADSPVSGRHGLIPVSFVSILWSPALATGQRPGGPRRLNQLKQTGNFYRRLSRVNMGELTKKMELMALRSQETQGDETDETTDVEPISSSPSPSSSSSSSSSLSSSSSSPSPSSPSSPSSNDSSIEQSATVSDDASSDSTRASSPSSESSSATAAAESPSSSESSSPESATPSSESPSETAATETSSPSGSAPEYVIALFEYQATPSTPELTFSKDDVMLVIKRQASGWLEVERNGLIGLVPSTFVQDYPR